jgi:hypothetical protein
MKPLKGRFWIGSHRGNGREGDLNRRGGPRWNIEYNYIEVLTVGISNIITLKY